MKTVLASLLALGIVAVGKQALAVQSCSALPNPIYVQVDESQEPLMKALGQKLRSSAINPITIVYKVSPSCANVDAMYAGTKLTSNPNYVPSQVEMPGWDPTQPTPQCTIDPSGTSLDIASSSVAVSACTSAPAPPGIGSFQGAIEPFVFVVPEATTTPPAITAEQAYFVFGFGSADQVVPWNDALSIFVRPASKSILTSVGASIRVPPAKWKGTPLATPFDVVTAVGTSLQPAQALGVLSTVDYDPNRGTLNALAYRTFGQRHAYLPDSTAMTKDKRNVRDGHYVLWSSTVYLAPATGGIVTNLRAAYVVNLLTNKTAVPAPDFNPLAAVISVGLVPDCAMTVKRTSEGGDLSLYSPAAPCACFFENSVGTAPATCTACTSDATCASGACRNGFCEAH